MKLHSNIIIIEILKLYFSHHTTPLSLKDLEAAFYTLLEIINLKENTKYQFDFSTALNNFLAQAEDYIDPDDESLKLTNDIEYLELEILNKTPDFSTIDFDIAEYIHTMAIYQILNIPIPLEETHTFFSLNQKIMETFYNIAQKEAQNMPINAEIDSLKALYQELANSLRNIDQNELTNIKICCAYYNYNCNTLKPDWEIALFSDQENELAYLAHNLIQYACPEIELRLKQEEEEIEEYQDLELNECFDNELIMLLIYVLISITNYLKNNPNSKAKTELTHRKYYLLSIPDLKGPLSYFLSSHSIDNITFPKMHSEYIIETSFEHLKPYILKCLAELKYTNQELEKNPNLLAKTILNIIVINAFLNLSINEKSKKYIEFLLSLKCNSQNPELSKTKNILDNILSNHFKPQK